MADLLDIVPDNSIYYVQRCIDIGNNRISQLKNQRSRYLSKKCKIDRNKIVVLHNGLPNSYLVPSERIVGKMYEVNMDFSVCQCPGMLRGPCKHKQIVAEHFKIVSSDLIPENDPRIRTFYHYLATGTRRSNSWYRQLNQVEIIDDCSSNTADIFGFMRVQSSGNQFSSNNEVNCSGEDVDGDILEESTDMDIGILNDTETIKEGFMTAMVNFRDVVLKEA